MDLKKVFDQTVRELKREVNKKVLKVPEIEVKILEATSNEPWGPHGTIMGDIAQATRNFNDYQMIMTVLYKRLNDTGRNWRHVYKALTVLEYLVANGAERVIDELLEHTYQIQTLCDFQYLEPSGKDQGINVRKKAQSLVALIKDKDRIREVRNKAAANRDKYRGVSSTGLSHRSSSYASTGGGYGDRDDDRYGGSRGRDDDRYGGSRGRDEYDYGGRSKDGDRYRDDDSYGRDRDRNRDGSRDRDGSKERDAYGSKGSDRYGSKGGDEYGSKGGDRYDKYETSPSNSRDRSYDDDDSFASRNGKAKGGSTLPPAYEEAVQRAPVDEDRDEGQGVAAAVARAQSSQVESTAPETTTKSNGGGSYFASQAADDDFDDFDPRGTFTATPAPAASQPSENLFPESATPSFFPASAAPSFFPESTPGPPPAPAAAPKGNLGGLEDLFGDVSFGAAPAPAAAQAPPAQAPPAQAPPATATATNFTNNQVQTNDLFGDSFLAAPSTAADGFGASAFQAPPAPLPAAPADPFGGSSFQLAPPPPPPPAYQPPSAAPPSNNPFPSYGASNGNALNGNMYGQSPTPFDSGFSGQGYGNQTQAHTRHQSFGDPFGAPQNNPNLNRSSSAPLPPQQPAKKEFGPVKSAIWGDTLSMGLVDLNIAGPKVNPLNDLGIQLTDPTLKNELWGADNPKQAQKKTTSNSGMGMGMSMGKAMGSGSGLGRAGASALPPPMPAMRPPMAPGMGMGMGMGPGPGPQQMGFNMGMGLNPGMGVSPGMGMGMGMGMGPQMGMGMNQQQMAPNMQMGGYPNQYNGYR